MAENIGEEMKHLIALAFILTAQFASAIELKPDAIECLTEINGGKAIPVPYDSERETLYVSKDGVNVSIIPIKVGKHIHATVSADVEGQDFYSQTTAIHVPKKGDASFMALMDFGSFGKAGIFCNLK